MRSTSMGRMFAAGTVVLLFIPSARASIDDGLIAHYTFDGTSGAVVDSTGLNNGMNHGAVRGVAGKIGNAFQFDGVDDYVDTPILFQVPQGDTPIESTTISVWINPADNNREDHIYGSVDTVYSDKDGFVASFTDHARLDYWSSNHFWPGAMGSCIILPDTWTHLTFTVDRDLASIYVNGMLNAIGGISVDPIYHDRALMFGKAIFSGHPTHTHSFEGYMDDVKIWDRALSPAEVAQVASVVPEPTTLIIWTVLGTLGIAVGWRRRR